MEHLGAVTNFDLHRTNFIQIYYITSNVLVRGRTPACVELDKCSAFVLVVYRTRLTEIKSSFFSGSSQFSNWGELSRVGLALQKN